MVSPLRTCIAHNLQRCTQISFSCLAYSASKSAGVWMTDRVYIVAGIGALVVGLLGNIYSRVLHGTAFTAMVTGILFLVPVILIYTLCHLHQFLMIF